MSGWQDRLREAAERAREALAEPTSARARAQTDDPDGFTIASFINDGDPWAKLHHAFSLPEFWGQMFLAGGRDGEIIGTTHRRHCLILGPPRCYKSTGVLAPQVITAPGPVVSTSTKPDMYRATAICRSRLGNLWHLSLDEAGTLPGCLPLRWSPVTDAKDWGRAQAAGHGMAKAVDVGKGTEGGTYFRLRAGELISALLHAAAHAGNDLGWVMSGISGSRRVLDEAQEIITRRGHFLALDPLKQLVELEPRSRDSIFSTAQTAVVCYRDPEGYETTKDPNFDPDAFVAGRPDMVNLGKLGPTGWAHLRAGHLPSPPVGMFDTIYITAPTIKQERLAPLITALLGAIREATFRRYARYERGQAEPIPPVLFALDECAAIAPLTDLPQTAAQGAGQGLLMSIVLQDLAQAEKRWKEDHKSFGSLFGDKVVFPGIENRETLQAFSELYGREWVKRTQVGHSNDGKGKGGSMSYTYLEELLPVLEPDAIARGSTSRDTSNLDPRRVLVSKQGGQWDWCYSLPYFNSPPFAQALVSSMKHYAERVSGFELRSEVMFPRFSSETTTVRQNILHAADADYLAQVRELDEAIKRKRRDVGAIGDFINSTPALRAWDGEYPFRQSLSKERVSLVVWDEWWDVPRFLKGFDLQPWEHWSAYDTKPDQTFAWEMEQAWFHLGIYSSPNSVWQLLAEQDCKEPSIAAGLGVSPAMALVFVSQYSIGEFLASELARVTEAPLYLTPDGEVQSHAAVR